MKTVKKILWWVLCFAAFLVLLPLLLLLFFAPLRYAAVARRTDSDTTLRFKASYLFRLFTLHYVYKNGESRSHFRFAGVLTGRRRSEQRSEPPAKGKKADGIITGLAAKRNKPPSQEDKSKKSGQNMRGILTYPELKTIITLTLQCIKKTAKVLLPKRLDASASVGFADPAVTGMFIGYYEIAAAFLNLRDRVRIAADFAEPGLRFRVTAAGSISIARLTRPAIGLVCKKPVRKFIGFLLGKKGG